MKATTIHSAHTTPVHNLVVPASLLVPVPVRRFRRRP